MPLTLRCLALSACCLLALFGSPTVSAEGLIGTSSAAETATPDLSTESPASKEAVRDLVSQLSDSAVRQLLIERLDAVAEADSTATGSETVSGILLGALQQYLAVSKENYAAIGTVPTLWSRAKTDFDHDIRTVGLGQFLLLLAMTIAAGVVAQRLVERLFRRRKQALYDEVGYTLTSVLRIIYSRLAIDILGVLAFFAVGGVIWSSMFQRGLLLQIGQSVGTVIASAWFAYVVMRFLFAPNSDGMRFCETAPERARAIIWGYTALAGFIVAVHHSVFILSIANRDHGGIQATGPYTLPLGLLMYVVAAAVIWANRQALTDVLLTNQERIKTFIGGDMSDEALRFARSWPTVAIVLIAIKYALVQLVLNTTDLAQYSTAAVYTTFFVILLWPALEANVNLIVAMGTRSSEELNGKAAEAHTQMQRGLLRVGRVFVVGLVIYSMALMWGLDFQGLAEAGLGAQAAGDLVEILIILLMAYVLWEIVSLWARRVLAAEIGTSDHGDDAGGDMGGVGLSRTATLVPIFEKTAKGLIVLVTVFVSLSELGINIAPLLAGSAVVGLAVGFGAQTLVKDIVSGLFFLADDAFRVAEYIEIGDT
ncbi:MAG: hypothetical protein AAF460_13245, partial [Pseudomonadota bacterium]